MHKIIRRDETRPVRFGDFNLDITLPGQPLHNPGDPNGLLQLGRFDHGFLQPGVFVAMHLHRDDEILSYLRAGQMTHEDSHGHREVLSPTYLMMMNAGSGFHHQESIPEEGEPVELLQIFLRPTTAGLPPQVRFHRFAERFSEGQWRLIAGPQKEAPLPIRSNASVYDCHLQGNSVSLLHQPGKTYLLHIFHGEVILPELTFTLSAGDSLVVQAEPLTAHSRGIADLVLFELDATAPFTRAGMFSGV